MRLKEVLADLAVLVDNMLPDGIPSWSVISKI